MDAAAAPTTESARRIAAITMLCRELPTERVRRPQCALLSAYGTRSVHLRANAEIHRNVGLAVVPWVCVRLPSLVKIRALGWRAGLQVARVGWLVNAKQAAAISTRLQAQPTAYARARMSARLSARKVLRDRWGVDARMKASVVLDVATRALVKWQILVLLQPNALRRLIVLLGVNVTIHGSVPRIGVMAIVQIID